MYRVKQIIYLSLENVQSQTHHLPESWKCTEPNKSFTWVLKMYRAKQIIYMSLENVQSQTNHLPESWKCTESNKSFTWVLILSQMWTFPYMSLSNSLTLIAFLYVIQPYNRSTKVWQWMNRPNQTTYTHHNYMYNS